MTTEDVMLTCDVLVIGTEGAGRRRLRLQRLMRDLTCSA